MIIEFELQGSKFLHKGIFDTTGFWVRHEAHYEHAGKKDSSEHIDGYKLYSHFSFAFYHTDKSIVDMVYAKLMGVLRGGVRHEIEGVGYIFRLSK